MNWSEMRERAIEHYAHAARGITATTGSLSAAEGEARLAPFPPPPDRALAPAEFVDRLVEAAFLASPELLHPFAVRLAGGMWTRKQIREWARQEYPRTVFSIRRHALSAANAPDFETLWKLITRVKTEADADPVGDTFFALPQLWLKFGIALGLSRDEMIHARPSELLEALNDTMLSEVRQMQTAPVGDLVAAMLEPVFHRIWGAALQRSLGLPHDALDYFWAIAEDRWGGETGRSILEGWASSREAQRQLWSRYGAERSRGEQWRRFTVLAAIQNASADYADFAD